MNADLHLSELLLLEDVIPAIEQKRLSGAGDQMGQGLCAMHAGCVSDIQQMGSNSSSNVCRLCQVDS
jgi:hypothetical protein